MISNTNLSLTGGSIFLELCTLSALIGQGRYEVDCMNVDSASKLFQLREHNVRGILGLCFNLRSSSSYFLIHTYMNGAAKLNW